ncbi:hypothetical protein AB0L53_29435 [Nonomuraea sp. NPDC052129]
MQTSRITPFTIVLSPGSMVVPFFEDALPRAGLPAASGRPRS